jgi:hypothetical protein
MAELRPQSRNEGAAEKESKKDIDVGSDRSSLEHDAVAVSSGEEQAKDVEAAPQPKKGADVNDLSSVPNGGMMAWLQVVGAFSLFFNSWYAYCHSFTTTHPFSKACCTRLCCRMISIHITVIAFR